MSTRKTPTPVAARVWRRLFDLLMSTRPSRDEALRAAGLTPNDARALSALDGREGRGMGELARRWGMDRSNATWVVDRLVSAGLVERTVGESDRRARLIRLTPKGARTKARLMRAFYRPPEALGRLSVKELRVLERFLEKIAEP